jgi:hypothetical protein
MSFQHPFSSNQALMTDAFGDLVNFDKDIAFVLSRKEFLNTPIVGDSMIIPASSEVISPLFYPNPSRDFVYCRLPSTIVAEASPLYFQLINSKGDIVQSKRTSTLIFEGFSIANLPSGNYWVLLKGINEKYTVKNVFRD